MKWALKEPSAGDIVRVSVGSIYHYGIYASDDEVIQFGLAPLLRRGVSDSDIEVCVSDVDEFISDGFLEVGVPEKKDGRRFSPKKTLELARGRVGEKGYNLIYNNCEHFAYECYCGEKISSQIDGVRDFFKSFSVIDVYVAEIPDDGEVPDDLFPPARQKEIDSVSDARVKREKYFVWKLFAYAVKKSFGKEITDLRIFKSDTGKWHCDACEFSLSHSHGVACVAVSKTAVGVDVEKISRPTVDLSEKILSGQEYAEYRALSENEKIDYIIGAWSKKESLFKQKDKKSLTGEELKSLNGKVYQKKVCFKDAAYWLSVAANNVDGVRVHEGVKL